jgi:cell division protein FtsA
LGAAEVVSEGAHKGVISSIEDVVSSVSACLEEAERMVGSAINRIWLGVSGSHIISQMSKGVVAVSKTDNEISEEDVQRAIEASRSIAVPLNYEVLHVLPKIFSVDGQSGIKDPIGMTGIRLEVDTQIILAASAQIKNITKAVYRAGLEVEDLVLSILAASEILLSHRQKELGVVLVNIGASTTSLAVFEEGDVLHTAVIPIGSEHITNDIAIGLRTSIDIAETAKVTYGDCSVTSISKREEIDLFELGAPDHEIVKKHYLSEIVQARVEEILRRINQELTIIKRNGLLPAGAVFTGSGSKIPGLTDFGKKALRLPVTLGYPLGIKGSVTDKVNDLGFSTAVGLVKWGSIMKMNKYDVHNPSIKLGAFSSQIKKWFKNLIP